MSGERTFPQMSLDVSPFALHSLLPRIECLQYAVWQGEEWNANRALSPLNDYVSGGPGSSGSAYYKLKVLWDRRDHYGQTAVPHVADLAP